MEQILLRLCLTGAATIGYFAWRRMRALEDQVRALTRRVYDLEQGPAGERVAAPEPEVDAVPVIEAARGSGPTVAVAVVVANEEEAAVDPSVAPPAPVRPRLTERMRELFAREEWEALVGGSLLNKLGALVLVVGIALFLSYSFTQVSPVVRVGMAASVSGALLGAGIVLERRAGYRVFSRGLLGGGWAGLYATAYAMYAIPATRVIESAAVGAGVLLAVAAGMVLHSLRYRAEAVTAVAYFGAFAALSATPSTPAAVVALLPLAASLLLLAVRFEWHTMALFGLVATYGTVVSRGSSNAPPESSQVLFVLYWVLFEAFDLVRVRQRRTLGATPYLFPLNAIGFLCLTCVTWWDKAPDRLWQAAALTSILYLGSAVARLRFRPPASFRDGLGAGEDETLFDRAASGSYEGALTIAALAAGGAIAGRVPRIWVSATYALLAEVLYVAGVRWRLSFMRKLAGAGFVASLGRLALVESGGAHWTTPALLHAALFYWNRGAGGRAKELFSYAGCVMGMAAMAGLTPMAAIGGAWVLFGYGLWEAGMRWPGRDLRYQGYGTMAAGFVYGSTVIAVQGLGWHAPAAMLLLACGITARMLVSHASPEADGVRWGAAAAIAVTSMVLAMRMVAAPWLGLAWCGLAVVLFEAGRREWPRPLTVLSWWASAAGWAMVLWTHFGHMTKFPDAAVWTSCCGAAGVALHFALRMGASRRRTVSVAVWVASGALTAWLTLPDVGVAMGWSAIGMASLVLAERDGGGALARAGHMALAAAFARLFFANFTNEGATGMLSHRLLSVIPVAAAHWSAYRMEWPRRDGGGRYRWHLWAAATAIFALLRFEMGHTLAVMGWAAMSLILLMGAARWKAAAADLSLQSAIVAVLAAIRCWTTNFQSAEMFGDAPLRWVTGGMVIVLFYGMGLGPIRERARWPWLYSVLATGLLTALLYHEVSGSLLTVVWGIEGLALLASGFPLRERVLRLPGLGLLLVCITKLFVYDLRNLETMYRILSFVGLGLILLGVSWMYARFRDRLRELL
ncbi:MAG: DUF2339 domain-containing protein [Bryobacteraceae bacterium]